MELYIAIIIGAAVAFLTAFLLGFCIIPLLTRLKFGQTILDIGPSWHKKKQGTPTMGGFLFIIGFGELFSVHRAAVGATYLYFPSAVIEMAAYLTMTLIASILLRRLEKRLTGSANYELVMDDQITASEGMYTSPKRGSPWDEHSPEADELERTKKLNDVKEDA